MRNLRIRGVRAGPALHRYRQPPRSRRPGLERVREPGRSGLPRPPPAGDHRPRRARQPADDLRHGPLLADLQRRDLQLHRAARGTCQPRRDLHHHVRQRGAAASLRDVGRGRAAEAARHVRLRDLRPRAPAAVRRARPFRHQAALLFRGQAGRGVRLRDQAAGRPAGLYAAAESGSGGRLPRRRFHRPHRGDVVRRCAPAARRPVPDARPQQLAARGHPRAALLRTASSPVGADDRRRSRAAVRRPLRQLGASAPALGRAGRLLSLRWPRQLVDRRGDGAPDGRRRRRRASSYGHGLLRRPGDRRAPVRRNGGYRRARRTALRLPDGAGPVRRRRDD